MFDTNTKGRFLSYYKLECEGTRHIEGEVQKPWLSSDPNRTFLKEVSVNVHHSETSIENLSLHLSNESDIEISGQTIKSKSSQSCELSKELFTVYSL